MVGALIPDHNEVILRVREDLGQWENPQNRRCRIRQGPECGTEYGDTLTRDLGRRIRLLRAERGWSQEVLAELAGLHRNYIGHVERAEINMSVAQLARIARAFGLRPGPLIDGPSSG